MTTNLAAPHNDFQTNVHTYPDPVGDDLAKRLRDDLLHGQFGQAFSDIQNAGPLKLDDIVATLKALFNNFASPDVRSAPTEPKLSAGAQAPSTSAGIVTAPREKAEIAQAVPERASPAPAEIAVNETVGEPLDQEPFSQPSLASDNYSPVDDKAQPLDGTSSILDQDRDENVPTSDPTYDAATEAMAASFGAGSERAGDFDHGRQFRAADINGEWSIGPGYMAPLRELNGIAYDLNGKPIDDDDGRNEDFEEFMDALDQIEEHKRIEREREQTLSQDDLDAMAWVGDENETWEVGGVTASRRAIYNAAKSVRKNIGKLASDNGWTDDERADQEYWLSEIDRNTALGNKDAVANAREHLKPETQQALDEKVHQTSLTKEADPALSQTTVAEATKVASNANESSAARADVLQAASDTGAASPRLTVSAAKGAALSNPPAIALKTEFAPAASPAKAPESAPVPVAIAAAASPPKLTQTFDI